MHATKALAEADRLMTICNSCRYCEGLCAVFPAMELRREFQDGDLNYLANLCHGCSACYYDCQFSPPHEFAVNVPRVLAEVRAQSYATYAWPRPLGGLFRRNGIAIAVITALSVAIFTRATVWAVGTPEFFRSTIGPGSFYAIIPHAVMVWVFTLAFLFACVAIGFGVRAFWRHTTDTDSKTDTGHSAWQATKDTASLRYLDGGGVGCNNADEAPTDNRKIFHHLTFYGFLLCFASTSTATMYHFVLGREAPYALYEPPVVLGILGGIGLIIGPAGLLIAKLRRDRELVDLSSVDMDVAFTGNLFLTSATGLLLLAFRETSAMGLLLTIHLGVVLALFLTMPYGKFVHGIYRFAALMKYAGENITHHRSC